MSVHIAGCNASHHQAQVDYDRDCPACMAKAALDQGKPTPNTNLDPPTTTGDTHGTPL